MEKFTNWRDKGTGIAPFLPATTDKESIFFNKSIVTNLIFTLIFIIKCITLSPLILLSYIVDLKQLLLTLFFGDRVKIDYQVNAVKRSELNKNPQRYNLKVGSIYVVNYSTALTGILLRYISNGPIRYLIADSNDIYELTLGQFINFTLKGLSLDITEYTEKKPIEEINTMELKNYVWILFAEGTCSNGKSVLPFQVNKTTLLQLLGENDEKKSDDINITPVSVKINNSLVTPLGGSQLRLLFDILLRHKLVAKIRKNESKNLRTENENLDNIRIALNDGDKYKLVSKSLNIEQKRSFVKEYRK